MTSLTFKTLVKWMITGVWWPRINLCHKILYLIIIFLIKYKYDSHKILYRVKIETPLVTMLVDFINFHYILMPMLNVYSTMYLKNRIVSQPMTILFGLMNKRFDPNNAKVCWQITKAFLLVISLFFFS